MTEANRHTYLNCVLLLTSLAWRKWAEGIGWVTCEGLSQLGFQIFRNLENGRRGWEAPQESQGNSGEEHLPENLGVIWRGPHGTPLRSVLTSRVLFYCWVPTAPVKSKQRRWEVPTPPRRVQGWQWFCGVLVLLPMCGAPYSMCSVAAVPGAGTHQQGYPAAGKEGWEGSNRILQLISAKQSHFGAEALVTVSSQDTSLTLNKSSSAALEPSQGGRSHLIRPKQLTATPP